MYLKRYKGGGMHINNFIEHIFSNTSKIKLLRFMIKDDIGRTGRELARFSGVSPMQAHRALQELKEEGAVTMRGVGNALVFRINRQNSAVESLLPDIFKWEEKFLSGLIEKHLKIAMKNAECVVLFGSVAEFKERARSDVDVFFLCSGEKEKKVLLAELDRVGMVFGEETGNLLSPFIMTGFEYRKAVKEEKGIIDSIKRGKVLKGKIPVEEG